MGASGLGQDCRAHCCPFSPSQSPAPGVARGHILLTRRGSSSLPMCLSNVRGLPPSVYSPGPQFRHLRKGALGEADTYTSNDNTWCTLVPGEQPGLSLGQRLLIAVIGAPSSASPGGWMLRMTRAQEQDRGFYSCLASNEAGEVRRNFNIEVLGMSQPHSPAHPTNSSSPT